MQKHKLLKNRLFVYLLSLYIVGIVFGIFINLGKFSLLNKDKNYFIIFFSNYWYIFLIWIFGFTFLGYIVDSLIVFFRAFVFGILIRALILNEFRSFIILFVLEILIFFPTLMLISYSSLMMSKENLKMTFRNHSSYYNINKYINLMLITLLVFKYILNVTYI